MESIIPTLTSKYFAPRASHPLLLPSIILHRYVAFCNVQFDTTRQSLENLRQISPTMKIQTDDYGVEPISQENIIQLYLNYNKRLQIHHARLVSEAYTFVNILGDACLASIPIVRRANSNSVTQTHRSKTDENEIKACVRQLETVVHLYDQRQPKLLSHLELILQEVCKISTFGMSEIPEDSHRFHLP